MKWDQEKSINVNKEVFFQIIFLALATYCRQYFAVFFIYFLIIYFNNLKLKSFINLFLICVCTSIPVLYYTYLFPALILEIVGPNLIINGYQTRIVEAALSLFCIATAIIFHNDFSDQMQLTAFLKNIALAGGFLFLVVNGAKGYCLDKK